MIENWENIHCSHDKVLEAIFLHAKNNPEKIAIYNVSGGGVNYRMLAEHILSAAEFLTRQGLNKGDCIMLSAQKEEEFIYLYFVAHLCGIINVVVDVKNNATHLEYIAGLVKPHLVFGVSLTNLSSFNYEDLRFNLSICRSERVSIEDSDTADIMFTSGTTGRPKGVLLSYYNLYSSANNINGFIGNTQNDVELLGLPICHSFGLGRLRCNMLKGATLVLHNGFANIKAVFSAFEKYKVSGFGMVPAVWAYIKRFSGNRIGKYAAQMKYIEIGSAAMPLEDKELLCELFPKTRICMHYGLTEASRAVFMEFHENRGDLSAVGKSVSDEVDVKIFCEDENEAAPCEEGEICVKGNMVMKSYFLKEDNEGVFINGYFRTGDWGRKDASGKIFLAARKKELINVGGKKVSPVEIEDALESIGVGESMCIAVKDPDGVLGEVPKALLVKGSFTKDLDEIKRDLQSKLENYKMPKIFEIVDSIPKTSSGKKQRTAFSERI